MKMPVKSYDTRSGRMWRTITFGVIAPLLLSVIFLLYTYSEGKRGGRWFEVSDFLTYPTEHPELALWTITYFVWFVAPISYLISCLFSLRSAHAVLTPLDAEISMIPAEQRHRVQREDLPAHPAIEKVPGGYLVSGFYKSPEAWIWARRFIMSRFWIATIMIQSAIAIVAVYLFGLRFEWELFLGGVAWTMVPIYLVCGHVVPYLFDDRHFIIPVERFKLLVHNGVIQIDGQKLPFDENVSMAFRARPHPDPDHLFEDNAQARFRVVDFVYGKRTIHLASFLSADEAAPFVVCCDWALLSAQAEHFQMNDARRGGRGSQAE